MILPVHDRLRAHLSTRIASLFSLDSAAMPAISLEYPPNRDLGDLGTPVAFELARRLRKAPRAIAQDIATAFGTLDGIRLVVPASNG
jgi:arginyl-tRNA synthetase